jgi:hypothetical protein
VNPIDVWEGIDTHEEQGRNRLVKLALHILSVIANSAGCERAFSHMGLVHTAIRSKLGVDKVRKTTIVGMDIKRSHIEAGLAHSRGRRNFEAPTATTSSTSSDGPRETDFDIGDIEDVLDFDQLADQLIEDAAAEPSDDSDSEDELPLAPPLTIRLPLHAIRAALDSPSQQQPSVAKKTNIPLKLLFIFPVDRNSPSTGIDYFWQGGIKNLDKEMEAYEIFCSSQESTGEMDTGALIASTSMTS